MSSSPADLVAGDVAEILGVRTAAVTPVGGGCIDAAWRVGLAGGGAVFAKVATGPDAAERHRAEAEGLGWLAEGAGASGPRVPDVLGCGSPASGSGAAPRSVLVLEWIEPGARRAGTDADLGRRLAALHLAGAPCWGGPQPGFLATLAQDNTPEATWAAFWWTRRLEPLVRRAVDLGRLDARDRSRFETLAGRLDDRVGPPETPARLHGDLWSGNVLVDAGGAVWVVDPAPYGGHGEVDLAMLALFGGFGPALEAAYDEVHPRAPGAAERVPLWQLYPLLAHVVLFGSGYTSGVRGALARLV